MKNSKQNPLHISGCYEIIKKSGFFDEDFYVNSYSDVKILNIDPLDHYIRFGWRLGRNPSAHFSTSKYIAENSQVDWGSINPLAHFLKNNPIAKPIPIKTDVTTQHVFASTDTDSIKNLIVLISGEATDRPGYIYRIERYAEAFRQNGYSVRILPREQIQASQALISSARLIYIWRARFSDVQDALHLAKRSGVPVIFDVDDLMVRPDLATAEYIDAIRFDKRDPKGVEAHYTDILQCMLSSDFCTASTHELAWQMRLPSRRKPTFVIPNGYSQKTYSKSRVSARSKVSDGLIRIGYASGSRTHQADFKLCSVAVAEILRLNEDTRLVLFRRNTLVTLDINEFPEFDGLDDQIEWRSFVSLDDLPSEIARFDINLAPLEHGNPFCECKSELKFFEAAICDVPTIASPTGPFKRAITDGVTGYLADSHNDWLKSLAILVEDCQLRRTVGREAHRQALWPWGPTSRTERIYSLMQEIIPGRAASRASHFQALSSSQKASSISIVNTEVVCSFDKFIPSRVTVIIPLFNYENYIVEALNSVKNQSMQDIDIVIVDDCSTDSSSEMVKYWISENHLRFNRATLIRHIKNEGLGAARNTAFDFADTLHIMTLDADNRLLPSCCEKLFSQMDKEGASFCYSIIQKFGDETGFLGSFDFLPSRLVPGNCIDAMAMISKEAWSLVGGYPVHRLGWQDYDFWCRLIDHGLHGTHLPEVLCEYRVHRNSMLRTSTDSKRNKYELSALMEENFSWLSLLELRHGHRNPTKF